MNQVELYDDHLDFTVNRDEGPFGGFAEPQIYADESEPQYDFFGEPVHSPFGIAAGPLPTPRHIEGALKNGFDVVTLKSVRTTEHPLNPYPQVRPVIVQEGETTTAILDDEYRKDNLTVANSFGIPSVDPSEWQPQMRKSFDLLNKGQALLVAFQGTARGEGREAFIQDHIDGIGLIAETGAKIIEINFSCPNEGEANLACFDVPLVEEIVIAVRQKHPDIKLTVKIAYFEDKQHLREFAVRVGKHVDGISAINTLSMKVTDAEGNDVFPGRPTAGVSGVPARKSGLEMVAELNTLREELGLDYKIIGIGGVTDYESYKMYIDAGADTVMSVAGAMWNPRLAAEIKQNIQREDRVK